MSVPPNLLLYTSKNPGMPGSHCTLTSVPTARWGKQKLIGQSYQAGFGDVQTIRMISDRRFTRSKRVVGKGWRLGENSKNWGCPVSSLTDDAWGSTSRFERIPRFAKDVVAGHFDTCTPSFAKRAKDGHPDYGGRSRTGLGGRPSPYLRSEMWAPGYGLQRHDRPIALRVR
jgi:hypothetical protein